jgi:hypothetical protein
MAKQTKITIESDFLFILRGQTLTRAWCPLCAARGEMISVDHAGVVSNLGSLELMEWLNSARLHRFEAAGGETLICLNSLLARVRNAHP